VSDDKSCVAGICEYTGQSRCEEWGDCSPCDMFGDECTCGTTVEGTPTCLNSGQEPPFRHKPAEPGYPLPKACSRSSQCGPGSVCVGPTFCQSQYSEDQWYSDRAYCYRRCGVQDEWD
jgi:hypothetical protein